jgi:sugar lactone lactonase YvrE
MRKRQCSHALILAISLCILSTGTCAWADFLYVSQASNNMIVTYDTAATPPTPTTFASTGLDYPVGLAFDSAGNLYASSFRNNTIEKFTPGGVGSVFASTGLNGPYGLAVDAAGNLYVANTLNDTIEKFTPGGVGSVFASSGLNHPVGLAFDAAGNLYAANSHADTIEKFTPGGVGSVFASTGVNTPYGLAIDSAGNVYVANNPGTGAHPGPNNTIEKFTPGGVGSVFATFDAGQNGPSGLAFDSADNLYVNINGLNLIEKFTPDGVGSDFATNPNGLFLGLAIRPGAVPEPSSLVLMGLGALGLIGTHVLYRWTKKTQAQHS